MFSNKVKACDLFEEDYYEQKYSCCIRGNVGGNNSADPTGEGPEADRANRANLNAMNAAIESGVNVDGWTTDNLRAAERAQALARDQEVARINSRRANIANDYDQPQSEISLGDIAQFGFHHTTDQLDSLARGINSLFGMDMRETNPETAANRADRSGDGRSHQDQYQNPFILPTQTAQAPASPVLGQPVAPWDYQQQSWDGNNFVLAPIRRVT
tara:strand:+ start:3986 stop:4627 length:642 start_codon:yes stop_codon:yes gene_type:complete